MIITHIQFILKRLKTQIKNRLDYLLSIRKHSTSKTFTRSRITLPLARTQYRMNESSTVVSQCPRSNFFAHFFYPHFILSTTTFYGTPENRNEKKKLKITHTHTHTQINTYIISVYTINKSDRNAQPPNMPARQLRENADCEINCARASNSEALATHLCVRR